MKTTLEIPDEVYRELKVRAAREGVTLTKLVVAALSRPAESTNRPAVRPLKNSLERKMAEWMEKEAAFLDSMRGTLHGRSAVEELLGGRR